MNAHAGYEGADAILVLLLFPYVELSAFFFKPKSMLKLSVLSWF